MKRKVMTKIVSIMLSVMMCIVSISAYASEQIEPMESERATEPAFMKRITKDELPFDFTVISDNDSVVTVSYNRTARSVAANEKMFISDSETGISAEKIDGTFDLSYNKVYKFSYQYESTGMKNYYDGEVSFSDSDGTPQPVFSNIVLNSFSSESDITRSAGVIYESESNDTYSTANVTYDDYDNYGAITDIGDEDWWRITFTTPGKANFWLGEIPANCDYDLIIYDSTGTNVVGGSVSLGNSSELVSGLNVTAGTYYAKVLWGDDGTSSDYYKLRIKWYPYTLTFNIKDSTTLNYVTGTSSVEIRGHYDNFNTVVYNGYGTVDVNYGRVIGINVRSSGYFAYVSPNTTTVTGDMTFNIELTPSQSIAQSAGFIRPLNISDILNISSPFGWRSWPPNNGYYANFDKHNGVDYSAYTGTTIKSVCDVSSSEFYSDWHYSMGYYVRVEDVESGFFIRYMHMREQFGTPYMTSVNQGDCIGYVGNTGNSSGSHLHIEIYDYTGKYYEPTRFWGD